MRPRWWRLAVALGALLLDAVVLAGFADLSYAWRGFSLSKQLIPADVDGAIRGAYILGGWAVVHIILLIVTVFRRGRLWQAAFVLVQGIDIGILVTGGSETLVYLGFAILPLTAAVAVSTFGDH